MQRSTLAKCASPLFFLATFAFYLYGIRELPLIGPDEPRYVEVAREMFLRGDFVSPTLGGFLWFEKPSLLYWMAMVSFRLFGITEGAARFAPVCAGLLSALAVFWVGRSVERASERFNDGNGEMRGLGLWCGAALASSSGMMVFSRGASFDVIVTLTLTLALACFFVYEIETNERKRRWLLAGFYAFVGASLLAKGLIGIIIPYAVIIVYFLVRREWPDARLRFSLIWGTALALLVAATWYAPVTMRHGWNFIDQFFIQHHFARYFSNKYHHPQPFYYYLPVMAIIALPWSCYLAAALIAARRWKWSEPTIENKFRVFALVWLVVPVAFFSASNSKLPGYVLPALPGAALLVGERLRAFVNKGEGQAAMRATGALMLVLVGLVAIVALRKDYVTGTCGLFIALPLLVAGVVALGWPCLRRVCAWMIVWSTLCSMALIINCAAPWIVRHESVRELMRQAAAQGYASTPVVLLHNIDRSAEFYAAGRLVYDNSGVPLKLEGVAQVADEARQRGGQVLVIVPVEHVGQLTNYSALETRIIGDNGTAALVSARVR